MTTTTQSVARADPLGDDIDLSGFAPVPPKKPQVAKEAIREVSEQNNFPSRAPERAKSLAKVKTAQRRRRTGRNVQFNIKTTAETVTRFTAIADQHKLVFGELLDLALDAFEQAHPAGETRSKS